MSISTPTKSHTNHDGEELPWKRRLKHFTWAWFECTVSTGAIAALLGQQPFYFTGLKTIGKIFFILDIVLFILFSAFIVYRFCTTKGALSLSLHHPYESFFFGTFWVSIAFILYSTQLYAVPACGPWLVKTLEVSFWLYAGLAMLVAIFQYHVIFDLEALPVVEGMPSWILPVYPFVVLGPLAGVLLYSQPEGPALPMLIGGLCFQGLGWILALLVYSIYFTRLINSELPEPSKRPAMYIAVGPAAYTANALIVLGTDARNILPENFLDITSIPVGDVWAAAAVPCAIFLWLLSFWFSALSTVSIALSFKKSHFSLTWWSFVYPNVALTSAAIQIGKVLHSNGIKAVCSGLTILLVIAWIFVAVMHVRAIFRKETLWPGMDEDMEDMEGHSDDEEKHD